jgi:hypothetical protein
MRNGGSRRIDDVQEGHRLRPRAPQDDASSIDALLLKVIRPFRGACTERRAYSSAQGCYGVRGCCRLSFTPAIPFRREIFGWRTSLYREELTSKSLPYVAYLETALNKERSKGPFGKV